uniref:Insulin-like polypeptide 2 n=1 Tax=Spodoptera littoralis TaxID=7109 RepID=F6KMX3_SPOLI|nr:insulin-like precursor polypeptide 2 [Spodoptera littoralis]
MKLILVSCLLTLAYAAANQTPVILCGRQLANARVLLCYGKEYVNKRTRISPVSDFMPGEKMNEIDWPWSGRRGSLSANWSRYKRDGLVDECCLKPCTTDVILNYC